MVWVELDLRQSGPISPDNSGIDGYEEIFKTRNLGPTSFETSTGNTFWVIGAEIFGDVKPSNFTGLIRLERRLDLSKIYLGSTLDDTNGPRPDTTADFLRDDNPQSGASTGRVYDLDTPGFSIAGKTVGTIRRRRDNFTQWAVFDGMQVSGDFKWNFRLSLIETSSGEQFHNDVSGDNQVGKGTINLTWDLK